jgi:hypothetical protein
MGRPRRLLLLAGLVVVLAVAGLGYVLSQRPATSGISQADAIRIARLHADSGVTDVQSAEVRRNFDTGFGLPIHSLSWVVTFNGHWQLICTGACDRTSEWVAIDYYTGEWIASEYSYQAPTH